MHPPRSNGQGIIQERNRRYSDEELIQMLTRLVEKHSDVSAHLIDHADGIPSSATYRSRFGTLFHAYQLAGYTPDREWIRQLYAKRFGKARDVELDRNKRGQSRLPVQTAPDPLAGEDLLPQYDTVNEDPYFVRETDGTLFSHENGMHVLYGPFSLIVNVSFNQADAESQAGDTHAAGEYVVSAAGNLRLFYRSARDIPSKVVAIPKVGGLHHRYTRAA